MVGRLTVQERAQIATRYEVWNSVVAVQMVAYSEGKKFHNPSGDNQELSFEDSDHKFGYGRTEKWPSIHIPI